MSGYLIGFLIMFGPIYLLAGGLLTYRRYRKTKVRDPFTNALLRAPGQSLQKEIADLNDKKDLYLIQIVFLPAAIIASHLINVQYFGGSDTLFIKLLFGVVLFLVVIVFSVKLVKAWNRTSQLRLGYAAEMAVGQELNQLLAYNFKVFHDFPAGLFNIDHVVVGPTGVFAVETKGRSKPIRGKGNEDAKVVYDGKTLKFPTWTDRKSIEQAQRQAKWLRKFLESAVGQSIPVMPALVIPGWYIEQRAPADFLLFNGKDAHKVFPQRVSSRLTDSQIQQIVHQLEQKCRDVEPMESATPAAAKFGASRNATLTGKA